MPSPLRIFIGYDPRESIAFHVLSHSILKRASGPISITPIVRDHLGKVFTRERGPLESTDFSISRFLVPYLSGYEGFSIFMDCDMLCRDDIYELVDIADQISGEPAFTSSALWVVKHDYTPRSSIKFLNQKQSGYRCKNWSSLMVFNNAECKALTPEYVNSEHGLKLHQFFWLGKDGEEKIGELPKTFNWLVGEYPPNPDAKILHYTLGTPNMPGYESCDHADLWLAERDEMLAGWKA